MSIKRFILKCRLLFSTIFVRQDYKEEKGFVYELDDEKFQDLSLEKQGVEVQKNWNRYMKE
tara:strand:- start:84 stop:266 length:183 start_codon:yes stop_codon:yes gene_type:complete